MGILHVRPRETGTITNPDEIQIGMWATSCCHRDLYQIKTQKEIDTIIDDWDEGISHDVYHTQKEALIEIRKGWDDPNEIAMIDEMLKGL
jgi:hypothetical protein